MYSSAPHVPAARTVARLRKSCQWEDEADGEEGPYDASVSTWGVRFALHVHSCLYS